MEITVAQNAGFCPGVGLAIKKANELLKQEQPVYCLGEIVHNNQVIQDLENKGMITVNSVEEVPENATMIIRSHGELPITYQKAKERNLKVMDVTCSNVKLVHDKVEREKAGSFIIIIGVKNHPEVIATFGFSGKNAAIIETEDDILDAYQEYEKTNLGSVYVVSHTTFSSKKFDELAEEIVKNFWEAEVKIDKTICRTTEDRQLEVKKMAKEATCIIVVGGKKSSNTRKLYELAAQDCQKTFYVQTSEDLENILVEEKDKIGIVAGASTPKEMIEEIKCELERKLEGSGSSKKLARI